jgi:hypothetical protein
VGKSDRLQYALETSAVSVRKKRKREELKAEQKRISCFRKFFENPFGHLYYEPATQSVEYFNTFFAGHLDIERKKRNKRERTFFRSLSSSDLRNSAPNSFLLVQQPMATFMNMI